MERNIQRLKRWCIRKKEKGWKVSDICAHARIPRRTFYNWWIAYQDHGLGGLEPRSRRPHTIHRTPNDVVNSIIDIRKQHGWGPNKIEAWLRREQIIISHTTIHKIICANGLNNPIDKPRKTWGKIRFVRNKPNDLWQCDLKLTEDDEWMITYLDDYSRYIVGSGIYHDPKSAYVIDLLIQCIDEYSKPKQILTDQGIQFVSARGGISAFAQFCTDNDIQHIVASKRRPTTIGKVESWHRAYEYERRVCHKEFVRYWNYERPHQGIGYYVQLSYT